MINKRHLLLSCSVLSAVALSGHSVLAQDSFTHTLNFESSTLQYNWRTTPWSVCQEPCGPSTQTRDVDCLGNDGLAAPNGDDDCAHTVRPDDIRDCNLAVCEWTCNTNHDHPPPPPPPGSSSSGSSGGGGDGDGSGYDVDGDGQADYNSYSDAANDGHTDIDHVSNDCTGACDGSSADTGDGGDGGDGKVLCTYFHRHGEMSEDDYYAGFAYGLKHAHPATFRGYHYWAVPYARHLYNNPNSLAETIMRPIVLRRAQEISYKMGLRDKPDYVGKLIRMVFEPTCFMIGLFVDQKDYSTLYTREERKMFKAKFKQHRIAKQAEAVVANYNQFILAQK